ncbi:MAG: hypothetical protein KatS3mg039_1530 [Candidatus Kapaibacterium sp.]|nr:MAG: hypothetical protein KatS3mg039_1530 [Candidatus Kapabacteria bacterium]
MMRRFIQVLLAILATSVTAAAQCAMCKSAVETTDNAGFVTALRDGIYLMLVTPYAIAAAIALAVYFRWRKRRKAMISPRLN